MSFPTTVNDGSYLHLDIWRLEIGYFGENGRTGADVVETGKGKPFIQSWMRVQRLAHLVLIDVDHSGNLDTHVSSVIGS